MPVTFPNARWIWLADDPQEPNTYALFRRDFRVAAPLAQASLAITADTRYWLWVNGVLAGHGPVRSWPQEWRYDTHDLTPLLHEGENSLSILVQHVGVGTFQSIVNRPGLLAELSWTDHEGAHALGTDENWYSRTHPAYARNMPRISCQLAFAECFDARQTPAGWPTGPAGEGWNASAVITPPEGGPWPKLLARDIPFLTEEPFSPVRVRETRLTKPGAGIWSVNLRPQFLGARLDSNPLHVRGVLYTTVTLDRPTPVRFGTRTSNVPYTSVALKVNGQAAPPRGATSWFERGDIIETTLPAGQNLLAFVIDGWSFEWGFSVTAEPSSLCPALPGGDESRFAFAGPFGADEEAHFQQAIEASCWNDLVDKQTSIQLIPREQECPIDVFGEIVTAQPVADQPSLSPAQALAGGAEWTTITPDPSGADVEIVLEFEKLLTGYLEFELIAPAGQTLDFYGFEAYQDGRIDHTWTMHNTLRYVTSAGYQHYRSIVRRGLRYLIVACRRPSAPIKIRGVRTILSTYPAPRVGDFRSSDPLLNEIYEISRWSTRMCMEDTFVDCPTYEQTFWVGDARNAGAVALLAFGAHPLVRRCLGLAARSLERSPLVESQVPSAWQNIHTCWSFLWTLACEEFFRASGDREFLEEIYPSLAKQTRYGRDHMFNEKGLLASAWDNLLEWAPMDIGGSGQPTATTHLNAWYVESCRRVATLADVLGHAEEAGEFRAIAEQLTGAINEWLWDEDRQAYIDALHADGRRSTVVSEQTNTVCLLCNVAPPAREALIRRYVGAAPEDFVRAISPFMLFFTLEALERLGEHERMLALMRETWGYMVEQGSTTCWENMPGWEETPRQTRSYCHAWSAAPAYFLPTTFLGILQASPGYDTVRIEPRPTGLAWAEGQAPTPHGIIHVRWDCEERSFAARVALPAGVAGELILPVKATVFARLGHEGEGLIRFEQRGGRWHALLAAGAKLRVSAAQ